MAWKEFSQLGKVDQQHENARQRMIVCQSCLGYASQLVIEASKKEKAKKDIATLSSCTRKIAGVLVDWVYEKAQDQDDVGGTPDTSLGSGPAGTTLGQLPEPTLQQKKVLDAIQEKAGISWEVVCSKVLDWASQIHGQRSYPTKLDSVDTFINWYNN